MNDETDPEYEALKRQVPPGWYDDAHDPESTEQYWDGDKWTNARRPKAGPPVAPQAASQPKERGADALVVIGYVTAVVLPIVGFVLGVVLLVRRQTVHGLLVLLLSVAVGIAACQIAFDNAEDELKSYAECIEQANTLGEMNLCE